MGGVGSAFGVPKPSPSSRLKPLSELSLTVLRSTAPFDPEKGAEGLPTRMLVLPWGRNETAKGAVIVDETTVQHLTAYQASQHWDRVALDFEHNTVETSRTYSATAPVAGYGTIELVEGEGIYLNMSSWTPQGKELAGGGHYGDLSAAVVQTKSGSVVGVHSVALCRHGATPGVLFLNAPWPPQAETRAPQTAEDLFAALISALQLPPEATPNDIIESLTDIMRTENPPANKPEAKTEEKPTADVTTLSAEVTKLTSLVTSLTETVTTLATQVQTNAKSAEAKEREMILLSARREGKEVPKVAGEKLALDDLRALCAELPVTLPLESVISETLPLSTTRATSGELEQISRLTGVTDDMRKKYASA